MSTLSAQIQRIYTGKSIYARVLDALLISIICSIGASDNPDIFFSAIFVYYMVSSIFHGSTIGRYSANIILVKENGGKPSRLLVLARDFLFLILFPLIVVQWMFGLRYSHELITKVIAVKDNDA